MYNHLLSRLESTSSHVFYMASRYLPGHLFRRTISFGSSDPGDE